MQESARGNGSLIARVEAEKSAGLEQSTTAREDAVATILITGATGFLGQEVVRALLARDARRELILLIRADDETKLRDRVAKIRRAMPPGAAARLHPLRGDVCEPRLGLDDEAYTNLCRRADRVIHVAASTKFDHPLAEARRRNVTGTRHVLDLCLRMRSEGKAARLDHVSTAYVAGARTDVVREDDPAVATSFRNSYEQSKCEAEGLLIEARRQLPIVIHRPSIIVGSSVTGTTTRYHGLYEIFAGAVRVYGGWRNALVRVVPLPFDPECPIDIVPVDYVAGAIATLFERDDAVGRTYHLAAGVEGASTARELVDLVCAHFHVRSPRYVKRDGLLWRAAQAVAPLGARLAPRLHRRATFMLPYAWRNPSFDIANARAAGLSPPAVSAYFTRVLDYAHANKFGTAEQSAKSPVTAGETELRSDTPPVRRTAQANP